MTLHEKLQAERAEGIEQEKIATAAKRLEEMELSIEQIAKRSGLSIKEVQKILDNITK